MEVPVLLFIVLLIVAVIRLSQALRRTNKTQILIFSICAVVCLFLFIRALVDANKATLMLNQCNKMVDIPPGDTATFDGKIIFDPNDPYNKQDSFNEVWQQKDNRLHLTINIDCFGTVRQQPMLIQLSKDQFKSLSGYLVAEQQINESIYYNIRLKAKKLDRGILWRLMDTIKITTKHAD